MIYIGASAAQANLLTTFINFYCPNSLYVHCLTSAFLQKNNSLLFSFSEF